VSTLDIASCQEHEDAIQVGDPSQPIGCEDCSKLIWAVKCPHCNDTFVDWRASGQDDVMSSAHYAQDGALLCGDCIGSHDANEMGFGDEGYIPDDYA